MSYTDEPANPFTQRKFVMSALVVGVVVVMGIILALSFAGGAPDSPSAATSTTISPQPSTSAPTTTDTSPEPVMADPAASVCGLPAGDQAAPTTPPEATWQLVGTMAMPTAENIGPGITSPEGIHSCYAHNPTGALFAAAGAMADGTAVDRVALLQARTVPSTAVDQAIAAVQIDTGSEMPDGYGGERRVQVAAFQFTGVTSDVVSMEILLTVVAGADIGTRFAMPVTYQWHEGDWRLLYQSDLQVRAVSSLVGYVSWGGA